MKFLKNTMFLVFLITNLILISNSSLTLLTKKIPKNCKIFLILPYLVLSTDKTFYNNASDIPKDKFSYSNPSFINLRTNSFLRNKKITLFQNTTLFSTNNFTIVNIYTIYNVTDLITNKGFIYNIIKPFDKFQFAFNITCSTSNCEYPNLCLNDQICACNNYKANFFPEGMNITNNIKYCSYDRKSQITLSLLEVFLPGFGFILLGSLAYGILKLITHMGLYFIIFLKLGRILQEDSHDGKNPEHAEYKRDLLYYLMLASYAVIIVWMFTDLFLIGLRIRKDSNGVEFNIIQIFK